jgi:hypothetical protein
MRRLQSEEFVSRGLCQSQVLQMFFCQCEWLFIQSYYKWFFSIQNAILSKVLNVQIRLIYETNRKLTRFVICAPVGSTSSVPLENGDKAREEFWKRMNNL